MSRSVRLLDLLQILRRHRRPVSGHVLAEELGVSIRTLYRDIATLQAQGAPIDGEAGLGYVLRPGFTLPPLMFSEDEIDAILLGLRFVSKRGDDEMLDAAENALAKIEAVLPEGMADIVQGSSLLAGPGGSGARDMLTLIRGVIRSEEKLRIAYTDAKGKVSDRTVWPVAIAFFNDTEILAAWCETRRDFRHFRFDRVSSATPTGERLPRRHRILLAEWRLAQNLDEMM